MFEQSKAVKRRCNIGAFHNRYFIGEGIDIGCGMYAWAAWTRNSFGMLANYMLLTTIDTIGLIRLYI